MLIDTHAHLKDEQYSEEKTCEIIQNMKNFGLEKIISASSSLSSCEKNYILAQENENIYFTVGVHPENSSEWNEDTIESLKKFASNKKCVAIGEIGLDYHYEGHNKEEQKDILIKQIKLAHSLNLPVVIHLRDAYEDMLNILKNNLQFLSNGFVIHCYSGSLEYAKQLLNLGAYFSFTGNITFKNSRKAAEVIAFLPSNRIMTETDSPYLSPEPFRGTQNEPKNVRYVFEKMCEIKQINKNELENIIRENVRKFYRI